MPLSRIITLISLLSLTVANAMAQPASPSTSSCVDVTIGTGRYYDCVNRRLQSGVEQHRFTARDAPYSAGSPDPQVGTFNQAATRERLGSAFGNSVTPQRPPPPHFPTSPFGH